MAPFDRTHTHNSSSIATMAISRIVLEIKQDIDRKLRIFTTEQMPG